MEPCVSCIYLTYIVWNICENLHYQSVYFKELHNEQEYYRPTIYRAETAVVSTVTIVLTVPYYTVTLSRRVTSFAIVKIFLKTFEASYFDLILKTRLVGNSVLLLWDTEK